MYKSLLLWLILFCTSISLFATHNRAGEISLRPVDGDCNNSLSLEATIVTYTRESSPVDRDSLTLCWGDGVCEEVFRVNGGGSGELQENDVRKNVYVAIHTYPARGTYVVSFQDPNRNGGILNVNPPNSINVPFYVQTTYTFGNPQFRGCNSTPILTQPPIDDACVGKVFTHIPGAFDPEEMDSFTFQFTTPLQNTGMPVPNYIFPEEINLGPNNQLSIDPNSGFITWDAPQRAGEYNIAIMIIEYRNGIPLDTMIRDMQIMVRECDNEPPELVTSVEEICVVAGELVEIVATATAPFFETDQKVRITANGGPFEVLINPATLEPNIDEYQDDPLTKTFRWQTTCEHISNSYYQVVFRAVDDFFGNSGLATLKAVKIKVVGPPPEGLQANLDTDKITLDWDLPYVCEATSNDYFQGFTVWRRENSNNFAIDTCTPGLAGRGYRKLTNTPIQTIRDNRYVFEDTDFDRGRNYCYRLLAEFALTSNSGLFTYNNVESLPSTEICVQGRKDVPIITNVSVKTTDSNIGQMDVCWSKPKEFDLDPSLNPGPYIYEVLRAPNQNPNENDFQVIQTFISPDFESANDTCFTDVNLNTDEITYSYKVNFYVEENRLLGNTANASSVFLEISPTDQSNILSWTENVPWSNSQYIVYRKNNTGSFDSIATVTTSSYLDEGLENGQNYCYRIKSIGSYSINGIQDPLFNYSQETCSIPIDNIPPCPPTVNISNLCDQVIGCLNEDQIFNQLQFEVNLEDCSQQEEIAFYRVYYASFIEADFTLLEQVEGTVNDYQHFPPADRGLAGCYTISTVDFAGNESDRTAIICVDNCPSYELPNTFTPNGDGQNDLFQPFPFCFIDKVDFQVFNRWGEIVFRTNDPNLNWSGINLAGKELAEGVYYYRCQVFEQRVESGISPKNTTLSGYIELIRGRQ